MEQGNFRKLFLPAQLFRLVITSVSVAISFLFFPKFVFASSLLINELMPNLSSGSDWVEIYNPLSLEVDLTNYQIFDSHSNVKTLSGKIPGHGLLAFDIGNRLNNSGDSIYLKNNFGQVVDSFFYQIPAQKDQSFGRYPDGGFWGIMDHPTKGSANSSLQPNNSATPNSTQIPSPTYSPNPLLNSTPPPTSSPEPQLNNPDLSSIKISPIPSSINSDQTIPLTVTLHFPKNPNSQNYLKGVFFKESSQNYLGENLVSNSWVKISQPYTKQLNITLGSNGDFTGGLTVRPDPSDSGFKGTGTYLFKVGRYDSKGNLTWSETQPVYIISILSPLPSKQEKPYNTTQENTLGTSTASVPANYNPSSIVSFKSSGSSSTSLDNLSINDKQNSKSLDFKIASISSNLARHTPTVTPSPILKFSPFLETSLNWKIILGVICGFSGLALLVWSLVKD